MSVAFWTTRWHTLRVTAQSACAGALLAATLTASMAGQAADTDPITGVWFVKAALAPFTHHMFMFNADGTMHQANPDAGTVELSASDGMGVWARREGKIVGKFVEVVAERATTQFSGHGEIVYEISVVDDTFTGTATANFYDADGQLIRGPLPTPLEGTRVTLP